MNREFEDVINEVLVGDARKNALNFVEYLSANGLLFERIKGYWEDKYYWGIKHGETFVCFVLIGSEDKTDSESWTIWSDNIANTFGDCQLGEQVKAILWNNVDICGNCGGCENPGGSRKTIFGKDFMNVCVTSMRFVSPDAETVACVKKMVEIQKSNIVALIE